MADWKELCRVYLHQRLSQFKGIGEPTGLSAFNAECDLQRTLSAAANKYLFKLLSPALWDLHSIYRKAELSTGVRRPDKADADTENFFNNLSARRLVLKQPAEIVESAIDEFARRFDGYAIQFIAHCAQDLHIIAESSLSQDTLLPSIVRVDPIQSDPHDDHFGVIRISLTNGQTWFYKPRSGAIDRVLEDFFRAAERCLELPIPVHAAQVIDCGDHHWSRQVEVRATETASELQLHSYHLGALTALAYCLNAIDLHYQNVLLGESLFVVDAETFFVASPPEGQPTTAAQDDVSVDALTNQLVRTSLVPGWQGGRFERIWDVTPLGSRGVFQVDAPVIERDAVGDGREIWTLARQENMIDRLGLDDASFGHMVCEDFLSGFRACFAAICLQRDKFVELFDDLAIPHCRSLLRSTRYYEQLIVQSFHPLALYGIRSRRDILVSQLKEMSAEKPWLSPSIMEYEASCLLSLSIPRFYNDPKDLDLLFGSQREARFFPRPALAEIRDRVSRAVDADLQPIEERIRRQFKNRFSASEVAHPGTATD